ncbi:DUF349 domain-containing protein [Chryseobacterium suipulveris]|uniref:DUF349 domain-containing protein n=1 Tax=Chryseobacterium suipulveris TaxID=2929800 RepID=A0ABY4BUB1_9FLAO|nr:DUF349 domain-containing protein [Chryseobacterium suipulveris]UOE40165.1 DUF349 domain-containing protein [Chryseobacterium suipulveris]
MITEDSISDNNEKKPISEEVLNENTPENPETTDSETPTTEPETEPISENQETVEEQPQPENQADVDTQKSTVISEEKVLSEIDRSKADDGNPHPDEDKKTQQDVDTQKSTVIPQEKVLSEIDPEKADDGEPHEEHHDELDAVAALTLPETLKEMETIINKEDAGAHSRKFNQLKEQANHLVNEETEEKKSEFVAAGNTEENFNFEHAALAKISGLVNIFREKSDEFHKIQQENQSKNLEERQGIIEKLKTLYTNTEAGTNLFKAIREIKEEWKNAGQVAKSEFKLLNNNYFHHLNQFYEMLNMNREYMEQEYAHNLEKRQHIIDRAKELENESSVQKALNELQYLHKLWKEEAEPVAEEFREKTWEEFREISNRIHERKGELTEQIEKEQNENLEKKNKIIEEIKKLTSPEKAPNHNYWQNAIKKIEDLRTEFLKLGSVPRKISNQNWNEFKTHLRTFNTTKNEFYKGLKNSQQTNLDEKLKLIQTAKDNMLSEDWDITVPLFKKLQDDWKKIGHVPRSMTNKVWDDFREACNTFFNNYREKTNTVNDNWKENYKHKKELLEELKQVGSEDGSVERIEEIKNKWNSIGKVPRDKISINSEFNKTLKEKLKLNKISEYDLKEEGLSENQVTDKARKIKNQIADLEAEISKLENNLGFFSNSSRENPLLKDTFDKIDEKKSQLENMKQSLHQILSGENQ